MRGVSFVLALFGTCVLAALALSASARAGDLFDLRGIQIGMPVSDLPATGYKGYACAEAPAQPLSGWKDWKSCAGDAVGLRAVRVGYDQPGTDGTFIAGHPVDLTLFFDNGAHLARVTIKTDPKARLYLRKKAYLLGQQARYRYGENRWDCTNAKPTGTEEPLGTTFIKEHCSKKLGDREVVIDRALYRNSSDPKAFVSESNVAITWLGKPT